MEVDGHITSVEGIKALGARLIEACDGKIVVFDDFPWRKCWLAKEDPPMVCAGQMGPWRNRFRNNEDHAQWAVVCNQLVLWASIAYDQDPSIEVIVSFTYTIMKQGAFTNKLMTADHVRDFLKRVKKYDFKDIPFPGITPQWAPPDPHGHNWRFCGSTHIWPTKWLRPIRKKYKNMVRRFIDQHHEIPLDLMIWPQMERYSGLPVRFYQAEYDYTQLTNFPWGPRCQSACL